uniref:B30.2/SPRY domain-containing protein n=1 Tax=Hucho hucho TaxID=62062 RepID=A0A4W5Q832_9TELE
RDTFFPLPETSSGLQTAVIILVLLLLLSVVFIGVLYKKRGQGYVLVLITALPYLKVGSTGKIVRDRLDNVCPPEHAYILGTPGFTSGSRAYWEVGLNDVNVGVKESWWVGLASGSVKNQGDVPATPSNGFWFLSSDKEKGLWLNMTPNILLPTNPRPETLGVYLDYDAGVLSFINVKDKKRIVTVEAMFTGVVFPLFNPGKGDKAPMSILDRDVVDGGSIWMDIDGCSRDIDGFSIWR